MSSNIKKLCNRAGMCDYQQQFKYIPEAAMVYTAELLTLDIPIYPMKSTSVKKTSARESLCLFTDIFFVKKNFHP